MLSKLISIIALQMNSLGEGERIIYDIYQSDWMFVLLIIPLILFTLVSSIDKYVSLRTIRIVFRNSHAYTSYKTISSGKQSTDIILIILGLISIATYSLFVELHYNITFFKFDAFQLWLFNLGVFVSGIIIRYIFCILTGFLSHSTDLFKEYFYSVSRSYMLLPIPLILINFFIPYLTVVPDIYLLILAFAIIFLLYYIRLTRLFSIFIRRSTSLFYLLLYLCTLEFVPVLIFIKYLSGQIS